MRCYTLSCELKTAAPIDQAFHIFENPYNLAAITPEWLNFKILDPDLKMGKGLHINYRIRWIGLPMRWQTIITDYAPPFRFIDFQSKGPYTLWHHTHLFKPVADGTLVTDEVRYVLPFGPLGSIAQELIVGRQLLEIFRYRQRKIAQMLGDKIEAPDPTISAPAPISEEQLAHYRAH